MENQVDALPCGMTEKALRVLGCEIGMVDGRNAKAWKRLGFEEMSLEQTQLMRMQEIKEMRMAEKHRQHETNRILRETPVSRSYPVQPVSKKALQLLGDEELEERNKCHIQLKGKNNSKVLSLVGYDTRLVSEKARKRLGDEAFEAPQAHKKRSKIPFVGKRRKGEHNHYGENPEDGHANPTKKHSASPATAFWTKLVVALRG